MHEVDELAQLAGPADGLLPRSADGSKVDAGRLTVIARRSRRRRSPPLRLSAGVKPARALSCAFAGPREYVGRKSRTVGRKIGRAHV